MFCFENRSEVKALEGLIARVYALGELNLTLDFSLINTSYQLSDPSIFSFFILPSASKGQFHGEGGSLAHLALDGDAAVVGIHQSLTDGQP